MKKANAMTAMCDLAHIFCKYKAVTEQSRVFATESERHKKMVGGFQVLQWF